MTAITMADAKRMIISCYNANEPLLIIGDPGMGKTSLFRSTAEIDLSAGYIPNILSQKDPVDVGGMRVPDMVTGILRHFVPEDLPVNPPKGSKGRHPKKGILHYDEINVVSMLMQATAYGIIQERRVGLHNLMEGWVPMASGNKVTNRAAAQRISLALSNRFNCQTVEPDVKSWLDQYGSEHVDQRGTAYLRFRPENFHVMPASTSDEIRYPSARSWTKAFKFIDEPPAYRRKLIAGYVGDTYAEDFEAYWRIMENATTFDEIIADPDKARLPDPQDTGTYYAITGMVSRLVERKNFDRAMIYVNRMHEDYQVAVIQDATRRKPELKNTNGYGLWAVKHQEVTL